MFALALGLKGRLAEQQGLDAQLRQPEPRSLADPGR
jgi:hypothetical protein